MKLVLHKRFVKDFSRLDKKQQQAFLTRRDIFLKNPFHPLLNNHRLAGKYEGYRSFNISGDVRVVFKETKSDEILFARIGTHNQLYE